MTPNTAQDRPALTKIPAQKQDWPGTTSALSPQPDHGETSWTPRGRLTGKRALITGGDSGIGRAIATTYAVEGADVAIAHLPQEKADATATRDAITQAGGTCMLFSGDLRTRSANEKLAKQAVDKLGGLDILVCNAAYQMTHGQLEDFPKGQIEQTFATNVFSPFWLIQALAGELEKHNGSIIVTTSIQAYQPSDHLLDYAATKAALNNLVVNLASELGPRGIRVNAVAPGPIWTPLIPSTMSAEKVKGFGSDTPLGRAGHPVEVAAAHVFLASDEASYVSGTVVGVTGGRPVF